MFAGGHRSHVSVLSALETAKRICLQDLQREPVTPRALAKMKDLDPRGHNAVHIAVAVDDGAFVLWAMSHCSELLEIPDMWGLKPLHLAPYTLQSTVLTHISRHPCAVSLLGTRDTTGAAVPHHIALANNANSIGVMVQAGTDVTMMLATPATNERGWPPLIYAAAAESVECCVAIAEIEGLANAADYRGNTFLHMVCTTGIVAIAREFAKEKYAGLWQARNMDGMNPAMLACQHGHDDIVMVVGGSASAQIRYTLRAQTGSGANAAFLAAAHNCPEVLVRLHSQGCPYDRMLTSFVNVQGSRTRVSYIAAQRGYVEILELLFALGGVYRRSLHDNDKRTLVIGIRNGHLNVLQFFYRRFPQSLDARLTSSGLTVAHMAARDNQVHLIEWIARLPRAHRLLGRTDLMGCSAAHWAAEHDHSDILRTIATVDRSLVVGGDTAMSPLHSAVTAAAVRATEWLSNFINDSEVPMIHKNVAWLRPYEIALIQAVFETRPASETIFRTLSTERWRYGATHSMLLTVPLPQRVITRLSELDDDALDDLPPSVRCSLVLRAEGITAGGETTIVVNREAVGDSLSQLDEAFTIQGFQPCAINVRFENEPASGDGLRREWLQLASEYITSLPTVLEKREGVYHAPRGVLREEDRLMLRRVGQLVVASVVHGEPLGLPLSTALIKTVFGYEETETDARELDEQAYRNQVLWVRDCSSTEWDDAGIEMSFVDEADGTELEPGGAERQVRSVEDRNRFATLLALHRAYGASRHALDALESGGAILGSALVVLRGLLLPDEVVQLVRGQTAVTCADIVREAVVRPPLRVDAGPMSWLLGWLEEQEEMRCQWMLNFATGLRTAPAGGLKFLMGYQGKPQPLMFCAASGTPGLPTAATCMNRIFVPMYSDEQLLKKAMDSAFDEPLVEFDENVLANLDPQGV